MPCLRTNIAPLLTRIAAYGMDGFYEAKAFFHDLATDTPLPKNLITDASVAGTS